MGDAVCSVLPPLIVSRAVALALCSFLANEVVTETQGKSETSNIHRIGRYPPFHQ